MNGGHNKHFSLAQEKILTDWMDRLISSGFLPRLDLLQDRANLLLAAQQDHSSTARIVVGKNWPSNFVARHPQYKTQSSAPLDLVRASSTTTAVLDRWFHRFKGAMHEYGITNSDIHNVNETGFQTGACQRTRLITWKTTAPSQAYALQPGK